MTFYPIWFPDIVTYDSYLGPSWLTNVLMGASHDASRDDLWEQQRMRYDFPIRNRSHDEIMELLALWNVARGETHSFLFNDKLDNSGTNELLGVGDGSTITFQLRKAYTAGAQVYYRTITSLVPSSLAGIEVDGSPATYSIDESTGIVTLDTAPDVDEEVVALYFEFGVPVRFAMDWLAPYPTGPSTYSIDSISLIEVRDFYNIVDEGFVQAASGQANQAALDTNGRIFTWGNASSNGHSTGQPVTLSGSNYIPQAGIFTGNGYTPPDISYNLWLLKPHEVAGGKTDWVEVQNQAGTYIAMDSQGKLYGWGPSDLYQLGIGPTDGYEWSGIAEAWVPNGYAQIVPTLVNNDTWSKYALGWYHVLGLKSDGSVHVWGTANYDSAWGNAGTYPADSFSATPIEMTWVPGPVKLIAADWDVSAVVTEDDEIYVWGEFDGSGIGSVGTPTQLSLTIPGGTTIEEIKCSYAGVMVRLSNGDVYAAGNSVCGNSPFGVSATLQLIPGGHTFIQCDIAHYSAGALDSSGTIWVWGSGGGSFTLSRDLGYCDENFELEPVYVAGPSATGNTWISFALGGWTHCAINANKELYTWGFNAYGELGINETQASVNSSCSPIQTSPATDVNGNPAF